MSNLHRAAVNNELKATVELLATSGTRCQPTIRVSFVAAPFFIAFSARHRWIAAAVHLLAAAVELESVGRTWLVVADVNAGTVALELVRGDEAEEEEGMRVLRAAVDATPIGRVAS